MGGPGRAGYSERRRLFAARLALCLELFEAAEVLLRDLPELRDFGPES